MSRFKIIIAIVLFAALVAGLFIGRYALSLHQVSFTVTKDLKVNVYQVINSVNQNSNTTVGDSAKISLQNGNYCAQPTDSKYDNTPVCFIVEGKDTSVTVEPNNSTNYLAQLLPDELTAINAVINQKYSAIIGNFTVTTGALYQHGEWYGGTLTQNVSQASDQGDVYRFVLHKMNNMWEVAAFPQIALNKYDYLNIPYDVLSATNKLVGTQS